jgi:hypothetical protein
MQVEIHSFADAFDHNARLPTFVLILNFSLFHPCEKQSITNTSMSGITPPLFSIQATDPCQVYFSKVFCRSPLNLPFNYIVPELQIFFPQDILGPPKLKNHSRN